VVGVAKTAFQGSTFATPVTRGTSARPVFVTARGMDVAEAARLVAAMHGPHRIPTLLGRVDRLARGDARR
jgi:deoxyribonuclease V